MKLISLKKLIILCLSFCTISIVSSSLLIPFYKVLSQQKKVVNINSFVKKSNIINGSYYLPSEYKLPRTKFYNDEYFKSINIEFTNEVNIESLAIEKIYFSDVNDEYGSAILNIENSSSIFQLQISNFLKKENWIYSDVENNSIFSKSLPSFFIGNNSKLSQLIVPGYECKFKLFDYDDNLGIIEILAKSIDKTRIYKFNCIKASFFLELISNHINLVQPSKYEFKTANGYDSNVNLAIDTSKINVNFNEKLLVFNKEKDNDLGLLKYEIKYNGISKVETINNLWKNNDIYQAKLFNEINYSTPFNIKFNDNLDSIINVKEMEKIGFFNIHSEFDRENITIKLINKNNEWHYQLNFKINDIKLSREFKILIYSSHNIDKSIDSNINLMIKNKITDTKRINLEFDDNNDYSYIFTKIDQIFKDIYLKEFDKTMKNQIMSLFTNFLNNFIFLNIFKNVLNNGITKNIDIYIKKLLNSISIKWEYERRDNIIDFKINLSIINHKKLELNCIYVEYFNNESNILNKISPGEKIDLIWESWTNPLNNNNYKPVLDKDNALCLGFENVEFTCIKESKNKRLSSQDKVIINGISIGLSFIAIPIGFIPVVGSSISAIISSVSILLSSITYVSDFFEPSETAIKYSKPLDTDYIVEDHIWDIYMNGDINGDDVKILDSLNNKISSDYKLWNHIRLTPLKFLENILFSNLETKALNELINGFEFRKNFVDLLIPFATYSEKISFQYIIMSSLSTNNQNTFVNALCAIIYTKSTKIIGNIDFVTSTILNNFVKIIIQEVSNLVGNANLSSIKSTVNKINDFVSSSDIKQLVEFLIKNNKNTNLVHSIIMLVREKWKNLKLFIDFIINELEIINEHHSLNGVNYAISEYIFKYCKQIMKLYSDENQKRNINNLLLSFGLKINSIMPIIQIASTKNNMYNLTSKDLLWITNNYIKFKNYNVFTMNYDDIELNKKLSKRFIDTGHSIGNPYAHIFRHFKMEKWQLEKMLNWLFLWIENSNGSKLKISDILLDQSNAISFESIKVNKKENQLSIDSGEVRCIVNTDNKQYYSKNSLILSFFNNDMRDSNNNVLSTYNFWPHDKGWKKITLYSQWDNSIYVNKKFDYKSKIVIQNPFEYEFDSYNNTYLFKTFIRFSVPKIDKSIINSFTNNILSTIEFKSSIGTFRNYILNFINDFVYHFWGLLYDY